MVRLPDEKSHDEAERINKPSELHKMLYGLFVRDISAVEIIKLLRENYGLALEDQKGRLDIVCNLSEGLIEQGREQGIEQGIERIVKGALSNGKTPEEIHDFCGIPLDTVNKVQATMADNLLVSCQNDENETLRVIEDARKGVGVSKAYTNIDDLMRDLNAGD